MKLPTLEPGSASPISRIKTLFEQMEASTFDAPIEDDEYRYVTLAATDEDRIVDLFRRGYSPAEGHRKNDSFRVVLKKPKAQHYEEYARDCDTLRAALGSNPGGDTFKGSPLSHAQQGTGRTMTDLLSALPDADPVAEEEA